jgi:hypothetical protein
MIEGSSQADTGERGVPIANLLKIARRIGIPQWLITIAK